MYDYGGVIVTVYSDVHYCFSVPFHLVRRIIASCCQYRFLSQAYQFKTVMLGINHPFQVLFDLKAEMKKKYVQFKFKQFS